MKILTIIPTKKEFGCFLQSCFDQGHATESVTLGRMTVVHLSDLGLVLAQGGLGKVEFAVKTQHLIDRGPAWEVVLCVGAAGALADELVVGDIVIGNETIEYDIENKFGALRLPRFKNAEAIVDQLKQTTVDHQSFKVYVGSIASGDEDVVAGARRQEVKELTGALANAWEGAGGARACQFSGRPYVEVRGVSDGADETAAQDYRENLPKTMKNLASLITTWATQLL